MRFILILMGTVAGIAVAVLVTGKILHLDSRLSASDLAARDLKAQVSTLWKENFDYREQLRDFGSRNDELEKEKKRLASQLKESQNKQAFLEKIAMDQAARVKELEGLSEALNARDSELGQKDEQLRSLTQELDVARVLAKDAPAHGRSAVRLEVEARVSEVPSERNVVFIWNAKDGRVEEIDVRNMSDREIRERLVLSILELQRDEKNGKSADAGLMADMFYNLGVVAARQGDFKYAVESFSTSLGLRSGDADCHYNLAVVYDEDLHDDARALQHYREYLRLMPETPELLKIRKWIIDKEAAVMVKGAK